MGLGDAGSGIWAAIGSTLAHGAADAVQPELASLAGSVGTTAGAQHASPADVAGAALNGLATRGALAVPGVIEGMTPAGRTQALLDQYNALTPDGQEQAGHHAAAADAVDQVRRDAVPGRRLVPDAVLATTAANRMAGRVNDLARSLDQQGVLENDGRATINEAMQAAGSPNVALTQDHIAAVRGLGLDEGTTKAITDAAQQVNILSDPGFAVRPRGPLEDTARAVAGPMIGGAVGSIFGPHGSLAKAASGAAVKPPGHDYPVGMPPERSRWRVQCLMGLCGLDGRSAGVESLSEPMIRSKHG